MKISIWMRIFNVRGVTNMGILIVLEITEGVFLVIFC